MKPCLPILLQACALLPAQQVVTVPQGLQAREGNAAVTFVHPFAYASARFQYTDAAQRGTPRPNLQKLQLRRDAFDSGAFPARTANVALVLSDCDAATLTTSFASNYLGTPSTVFARKLVSLPDHTQAPASPPAPWSITIPFDVPWSYSGLLDLLWEIQLDTNTQVGMPYSLDAVESVNPGQGSFEYNGLVNCVTPNGSYDVYAFAPVTTPASLATIATYALRGPSSAAGVLALGLSDPNLGGVLCAPVRTSAEVLLPAMTDAFGAVASPTSPMTVSFPWMGFGALNIYSQFASLDASQPFVGVALSDGVKHIIVDWLPRYQVSRLSSILSANAVSGTRSAFHVPVAQLTY